MARSAATAAGVADDPTTAAQSHFSTALHRTAASAPHGPTHSAEWRDGKERTGRGRGRRKGGQSNSDGPWQSRRHCSRQPALACARVTEQRSHDPPPSLLVACHAMRSQRIHACSGSIRCLLVTSHTRTLFPLPSSRPTPRFRSLSLLPQRSRHELERYEEQADRRWMRWTPCAWHGGRGA